MNQTITPPGITPPGNTAQAITLRAAQLSDLPQIQEIYAHHVATGLASFEESPPDLAEMTRRFETLMAAGYPYLVAEVNGPEADSRVEGYAYAGAYRARPAYRFSVENSIYVRADGTRRGLGKRLLEALIDECAKRGYRQMVAVIGDSANHASIGVHAACGFEMIGTLPSIGFKFGRWVDSVLMQRPIGPGDSTSPV
ncbi:N-acetyltransferase family protein [Ferrovibrio sp.]|uniref:GNAT family N-acetyltransferase n=1 Tax=Ferrovibrio sp. TaxID=1917215 RepID=UPI0035B2C8AF